MSERERRYNNGDEENKRRSRRNRFHSLLARPPPFEPMGDMNTASVQWTLWLKNSKLIQTVRDSSSLIS